MAPPSCGRQLKPQRRWGRTDGIEEGGGTGLLFMG